MFRTIPDHIADIVWIATGFIGDVVLTTAGSELAGKKLPGIRQHLVTTPIGVKALAKARGLTSLIAFDKRADDKVQAFKKVAAALNAANVERKGAVILQVHRSFRSSLLSRYLGYPTITYKETNLSWLSDLTVSRVAVLHEAARISLLLEPAGIDRHLIITSRPYLDSRDLRTEIQHLLPSGSGPLVAIAPGSVWGTKRWTSEGFINLARKLVADGARIVLVGSNAEKEVASEIYSQINRPEVVVNLAGVTSLEDLPGLFGRCALLISNDSSPIHFASAVNLPTVGIFGATVPEMGFGPLADRSTTVGFAIDCRPCSDHGPMVCPLGHFKCMRELSAERVYLAAQKILSCL